MAKNSAEDDERELPEVTDEDLEKLADGFGLRQESIPKSPASDADLDRAIKEAGLKSRIKWLEFQEDMISWTKRVVNGYLLFVFIIIWLYISYNVLMRDFIAEKEVIMTLLASTTASIIGLPFAINKSIFIDKDK